MEADDWKSLPGGFFYKSFVRQYADALGLDPDEIEKALAAMQVEETPLPSLEQRQQKSRLRDLKPIGGSGSWKSGMRVLPSLGFLVVVVVGCGVLYSWWHRLESHARANETSPPVVAAARRATAPPAETRPVTPQVSTVPEQPPAAAPPAPAPADAGDGVRLTLAATEDTWVSVTADGHNVFSGVIKGQEHRNIEGKQSTRLRIGNAGGITVEWNGRPLGTLGKRGEVRDVVFTPDSYKLIEKPPSGDEDAKPESTT